MVNSNTANCCPNCQKKNKFVLMEKGALTEKCPSCGLRQELSESEMKEALKKARLIQTEEERIHRALTDPGFGDNLNTMSKMDRDLTHTPGEVAQMKATSTKPA